MKKILITGTNSYVGTSFQKWLEKYCEKYSIDTITMRGNAWKKKDFSAYDVVLHVAGIAHVSSDPKMESLYYTVNRDLTIETAKKAKAEGVKQFIFMSSIIVYGDSSHINKKRVIEKDTVPTPSNFYGNSKLQAEEGIKYLESSEFKIVIIRSPMIYGKGSKGNYQKLVKVAKSLPIFPYIKNERSMIHIDNLCEFIRIMIDNNENGLFFPQNKEFVITSEMVKLLAEVHGRKIRLVKTFNVILILMSKKVMTLNKVFGNLVYESKMSEYKEDYCVNSFRESIMNEDI